jgi:hypothetical protein
MTVFSEFNKDIFWIIKLYLTINEFNNLSITNCDIYNECRVFKTYNLSKDLSIKFVRDEYYRNDLLTNCYFPKEQIKLDLSETDITNNEINIFNKIKVNTLNLSKCNRILNVDCLTDIPNLNLSYCDNIRDVSGLNNINNLNLEGYNFHIVEKNLNITNDYTIHHYKNKKTLKNINNLNIDNTNLSIGKRNFSKENIVDYIQEIELFDDEINKNIKVEKIVIDYDNYPCLSIYSNINYLENKQIIILSNFYCIVYTNYNYIYKAIYNPIIHVVDFSELDTSPNSRNYFHNVLIFDKEISFNKILKYCQLYFNYELKKHNFPLKFINNLKLDFTVENDIKKKKQIIFNINNRTINNLNIYIYKNIYELKFELLENMKIKEHNYFNNQIQYTETNSIIHKFNNKYEYKNNKSISKKKEQIYLIDNDNNNIEFNILKMKMNSKGKLCLNKYRNKEKYSNKQIIFLSNYLYYENRDNFAYKLLSNPIIYIINPLNDILEDLHFKHDVLIFDKETSFNEILKYCQLYFNYELKKYNFPTKIIKKFNSYFNVENDIDMQDLIIFDIHHKKISNNLKFDTVIYENKNLTYLDNKNM